MNKILDTVEQKWISKKELMSICNCSDKTLETAIKDLNIETGFDIQIHMKTGGYHNLETFYDED